MTLKTMTLICAPNHRIAMMIARGKELPKAEWRYVSGPRDVMAVSSSTVELLAYWGGVACELSPQQRDALRDWERRGNAIITVLESELVL